MPTYLDRVEVSSFNATGPAAFFSRLELPRVRVDTPELSHFPILGPDSKQKKKRKQDDYVANDGAYNQATVRNGHGC